MSNDNKDYLGTSLLLVDDEEIKPEQEDNNNDQEQQLDGDEKNNLDNIKKEIVKQNLITVSFNQDQTCFTCLREQKLQIYNLNYLDQPFDCKIKNIFNDKRKTVKFAEMLECSNIIFLVFEESDEVIVWRCPDDNEDEGSEQNVLNNFGGEIIQICVKDNALAVVLKTSIFLISLADYEQIDIIEDVNIKICSINTIGPTCLIYAKEKDPNQLKNQQEKSEKNPEKNSENQEIDQEEDKKQQDNDQQQLQQIIMQPIENHQQIEDKEKEDLDMLNQQHVKVNKIQYNGKVTVNIYQNDMKEKQQYTINQAHINYIQMLKLSQTGKIFATTSQSGNIIRIFETKTGQKIQELRRGVAKSTIHSIVFHFDEKYLACTSDKGTVHLYALKQYNPEYAEGQDVQVKKFTKGIAQNQKSMFSVFKFISPFLNSEWNLASLNTDQQLMKVAFGPQYNQITVVSSAGECIQAYFDYINGGDCLINKNFNLLL